MAALGQVADLALGCQAGRPNRPGAEGELPEQNAQKGRLARAVGTEDGGELAPVDGDVHPAPDRAAPPLHQGAVETDSGLGGGAHPPDHTTE